MIEKLKYPLSWNKEGFSIKIFCSIPNIATGILLKTRSALFVVDPGDGILRDLNRELEVKDLLNISEILITHGHHDHVGGVWSLLTYLRVMKKKTPLNIYFPEGCVEIESIHNAFERVYAGTISYKINMKKISKSKSIKAESVTVKPFPVIHKEYLIDGKGTRQVPALGYNFTYDKKTICYGGDTAYCEEIVTHAKNADLAILEAGHDDDTPDEMHMTKSEAESIGKSAKDYFLVHVPE
jgi:ribonuclease Z